MNRTQYRAARRSTIDNGHRYTARHATPAHRAELERLQAIQDSEDLLQLRARWMSKPDTTTANILKLTRNH